MIQIVLAPSFKEGILKADPKTRFFILSDDDLYLETLDIRANLLMCEQWDGATGFSDVIDLTPEQAQLLRATRITRGIDISKSTPAENVQSQCRFSKRDALTSSGALESETRLFQSPNHALRLPSVGGDARRK